MPQESYLPALENTATGAHVACVWCPNDEQKKRISIIISANSTVGHIIL